MSRLFRLLTLVAALQLLGGHWVVLQTAAWISMTVEYAKTDSLSDALSKTLDGKHPCKLCHVVKKGREAEDQQPQFKIALKTEALLTQPVSAAAPSFVLIDFPVFVAASLTRSLSPPTPPPLA